MEIHHEPANGESQVLSSSIATADSKLSQARGLMFKRNLPDDFALVLQWSKSKTRGIHSMFVFQPIDVVWVTNNTVVQVKRLNPFRGIGFGTADCIIELPTGGAEGVTAGDTITIKDST